MSDKNKSQYRIEINLNVSSVEMIRYANIREEEVDAKTVEEKDVSCKDWR